MSAIHDAMSTITISIPSQIAQRTAQYAPQTISALANKIFGIASHVFTDKLKKQLLEKLSSMNLSSEFLSKLAIEMIKIMEVLPVTIGLQNNNTLQNAIIAPVATSITRTAEGGLEIVLHRVIRSRL